MFCLFSGPMMHQQPPSQQYNMPQGGGQHYQGQQPPMGMMGQVNQGNHMMGQRQIPPFFIFSFNDLEKVLMNSLEQFHNNENAQGHRCLP